MVSKTKITQFSEVITAVCRLAEQRPEETAADMYFRDAKPCCIFGHAFHELGLTATEVQSACAEDEYSIAAIDLNALGFALWSDEQLYWAAAVQNAQDRGATWHDAVHNAGPVPA